MKVIALLALFVTTSAFAYTSTQYKCDNNASLSITYFEHDVSVANITAEGRSVQVWNGEYKLSSSDNNEFIFEVLVDTELEVYQLHCKKFVPAETPSYPPYGRY